MAPEGWYIRLKSKERVIGKLLLYNERYYFTVYNSDSLDVKDCSINIKQGRSFLYEVSAVNGRPIFDDNPIIADLGTGQASEPVLTRDAEGNISIVVARADGDVQRIDIQPITAPAKPNILWWKVN